MEAAFRSNVSGVAFSKSLQKERKDTVTNLHGNEIT